jgi:hypothetical protein
VVSFCQVFWLIMCMHSSSFPCSKNWGSYIHWHYSSFLPQKIAPRSNCLKHQVFFINNS